MQSAIKRQIILRCNQLITAKTYYHESNTHPLKNKLKLAANRKKGQKHVCQQMDKFHLLC